MSVTVRLLAERPDLVEALADALGDAWPDWYGLKSREEVVAEVRGRAQAGAIPLALVALDGERLVGTAALSPSSIPTHAHLSPWLVGLWVEDGRRGRGVGADLLRRCREEAARLGFAQLYAATATARSLFERDGWEEIDNTELPAHPGEVIGVFRYDLAQLAPSRA